MYTKFYLILATMLVWAASASAVKITHGPYLQMVGENEVVVVWTTDKKALSWVEVAPDDGTHFYACQRDKYYEINFGKRALDTLHKVKIHGDRRLETGKESI